MTGRRIAANISKRFRWTTRDSVRLVELFFRILGKNLREGKRVELRGFGVFRPTLSTQKKASLRVSFRTSATLERKLEE